MQSPLIDQANKRTVETARQLQGIHFTWDDNQMMESPRTLYTCQSALGSQRNKLWSVLLLSVLFSQSDALKFHASTILKCCREMADTKIAVTKNLMLKKCIRVQCPNNQMTTINLQLKHNTESIMWLEEVDFESCLEGIWRAWFVSKVQAEVPRQKAICTVEYTYVSIKSLFHYTLVPDGSIQWHAQYRVNETIPDLWRPVTQYHKSASWWRDAACLFSFSSKWGITTFAHFEKKMKKAVFLNFVQLRFQAVVFSWCYNCSSVSLWTSAHLSSR